MVNWTVLPETFYNEDCSLNVSISETVTQTLQMDNTNVTIVDSTVQKVDTSVSFYKWIFDVSINRYVQISKYFLSNFVIIILPISLNMCFVCSKELSH